MSDYLEHRRNLILQGRPLKQKEHRPIPKISEKRKKKLQEQKDEMGDSELQKWFRARMKVMGERCYWCGCKVENKIYRYAIFSICHILDKRETKCPSVKTHPLNWVTLCPDHHNMFDTLNWEERERLGFWETLKERLIMMYPDLAPGERRFYPESVLKIIDKSEI